MSVLGLDTATPSTVVGLLRADGELFEARDDPPPGARPGHASRLLVAVEDVLARAGVGWEGVERIAVGVGPGGFTGLRIGIATARALAQARGLPLVGVSTLEAVARGASADTVIAAIDARRGEIFAAAWRGGELLLSPAAFKPEDLVRRVASLARAPLTAPGGPPASVPAPLAVGDGAVRFREHLERAGARVPPDGDDVHRLHALQVCRLGAEGRPGDRDELLPDYLREPDAVPRR
jgi:tRNA threonylcarbamoyladenosine biosynthesis protein TsaB